MSKIKIIKNDQINLNIPKFNCDENIVGKHMNDHPLTKLMNCYGFIAFVGKPQSGKTSLAISFITQRNPVIFNQTHHKLYVMMPQNSINSMEKNPFKKLPPENMFNELTDETIQQVYNLLESNTAQNLKTLLLIDDMTADLKRSKFIESTLKKIVYNRRHLKCNIIITAQSFNNMPFDIRKNITSIFMFKPAKAEMQKLFEDLIEAEKDNFSDIMRYTFDKKHNFLFVNIESQRMFKNWDEIVIQKDEVENNNNEEENIVRKKEKKENK